MEIILVSLLMFLVISQFPHIPEVRSEWPKTKLFLQGNDIINTLKETNINWFVMDDVTTEIEKLVPGTMKYGMEIRNVIKPKIYVGCVCSPSEYNDISQALTQPAVMTINDQAIEFFPTRLDTVNPQFPTGYDVIIIGEEAFNDNVMNNYVANIQNFLGYGKGIIEIVDLDDQVKVNNDLQRSVFNLKWDDDDDLSNPDSGRISFSIPSDTYTLVPPIEKYFHHFPNVSGDFYEKPHTFDNMLENGPNDYEKILPYDDVTDKVIMQQTNQAVPPPAAIINYNMVSGTGRTVWLSNTDLEDEDVRVLIKSLTVWAAGDTFEVMTNFFLAGEAVSFSFFKVLNKDMYQPIEIMFTLGYLYTFEA